MNALLPNTLTSLTQALRLPTLVLGLLCLARPASADPERPPIRWPEGKRMALSLSFDDSRVSNLDHGIPLLNELGLRATFFVLPRVVEKELDRWRAAVAQGHEMGNHSLLHPCSGHITGPQSSSLEEYTLERMRAELVEANLKLEALLGVKPQVYAYPCGLTYVGKGRQTQSFVPLIAELFLAGRGWLDERPNDVLRGDLAQITGVKMDGETLESLLPMFELSQKEGRWLVLAGHDTAESGTGLTTHLSLLRDLAAYAKDPANGIWVAPIGEVAAYVKEQLEGK